MPMEKIVLNASPLILLGNDELDFILPELFTEIICRQRFGRKLWAFSP